MTNCGSDAHLIDDPRSLSLSITDQVPSRKHGLLTTTAASKLTTSLSLLPLFSSMTVTVIDSVDTFRTATNNEKITIIDFWATW